MSLSGSATLKQAAQRSGCSDDELDLFATGLQALSLREAARINPFAFATTAGLATDTATDLFVHGAKLGLFDLEWGMVCPLCGAITNSVPRLDGVAEDVVFCALCNRDAPSVLDDTVEVTFAYNPANQTLDLHEDFPAYLAHHTSASYPYREGWQRYHKDHTAGDLKLGAGEQGSLRLQLKAGQTYRLLCLDTHSGAMLEVADDALPGAGDMIVPLSLSADGFSETELDLPAGEVTLALTNLTDQPIWCRVLRRQIDEIMAIMQEMPPPHGPRLTGKHLLNNQAFRDSFALHELAPDLKLKLRNITLLFTDLKGSTALYDREGDLAAYRLVQDHFVALKEVVRTHSGAMIKTMGDAVMAAFPDGSDGTAAAIEMMTAMQDLARNTRSKEVGLKVGLHAGPALAINAGSGVDYFGQTVNIAARVQGLADAGDICVTGILNDEKTIPELLTNAGYRGSSERAKLKGVTAAEQIYRYRIAA